jgi:diguanylate cyclase (GGDEF)-like protein
MKPAEYTVSEMRDLLDKMSGMYNIARVVNPMEARVLEIGDDGRVGMSDKCYKVWGADQRCTNCSSTTACISGCHREKKEHYQDNVFNIHSNPVKLIMDDGASYEAVVELINITSDSEAEAPEEENDRAAENVGGAAARYYAYHDNLTKLLDIDAFYEFAREKLLDTPDTEWTMVVSDITDFRMINNLFGIGRGNEILIKAAELISELTERAGGLSARIRDDRFAMLIPGDSFSREDLDDIARVMTEYGSNGVYKLRFRFGVYSIGDTVIPVSVMIDRAKTALATVKSDAREAVAYYDDEMLRREIFEHRVISRFESLLNEGRFRMYLQPLTDENGKPFGAEALVRCIRADGTIVPPADFIGTLEDAGLIHELDSYVWEQAVRQLSLWKGTEREDLIISVNMSGRDFFSMDVFEVLTGLLDRYGVSRDKLRLEITETALIDDMDEVNDVILRLRDEGFYIEIDDFGKGYSSLSMLRNIPADMLKLDMGFLHESEDDVRCRIIVGAVIKMARDIDMDVLVEGVETERQLRTLAGMGCRCFQGYYFSKPLPVEEFEKRY